MSNLETAAQQALELLDKQWRCEKLYSLEEVQDAADALRAALTKPVCNCSMKVKLVADGCAVCNPDLWEKLGQDPN